MADEREQSEGPARERRLAMDVRFCPFCGQMSFTVSPSEEGSVYCEFCGIDVAISELVLTP